ncbi:hypothetical protein P1S61_07680 [Streptomyces sp. ME08-AFT2]|nr:hypothetical protein [Streptomyces sp. ME08-AFT2]MDX3308980.1 hypothetical protein [Streptomyces sp. ME08-AFT2]
MTQTPPASAVPSRPWIVSQRLLSWCQWAPDEIRDEQQDYV